MMEAKETKKKSPAKRDKPEVGERKSMLILLLVTSLVSLLLYLKQKWAAGMRLKLPRLGGVERVTFSK